MAGPPQILTGRISCKVWKGCGRTRTAFWPWSAKIRRASKSPAFCTVVLTGERAGGYAVECGYPGPEGPVLLERQVPSIQEVVPVFESVYRQRDAVLSGFADLSDAMGRNESTR